MRIIIYGAISEPIIAPTFVHKLKSSIKKQIYAYRDLVSFKFNRTSFIDYRNYDNTTPINIGDVAITEAVAKYFIDNYSDAVIEYCNWNNLSELNRVNPLSRTDWIVIPGGGYFMFSKENKIANRISIDTDIFAATGANVVMFGVGINRPGHASNDNSPVSQNCSDIIKRLLSLSKLISVRDLYSKEFLETYTHKSIELIGDSALHLASQLGISQLTQEERIHRESPVIGLNFSFHGPVSNIVLKRNIHKYIDFLKDLQLICNCSYYYIIHYESDFFIPKLLASKGIKTTVIYGTTSVLLKAYSELDLHIGGMLHSCIFSYCVDTPAIGLAYDIKHLGFFKLFGATENCLSVFDFDNDLLLRRTLDILSAPEPIRFKIATRRAELKDLTKTFVCSVFAEINKNNCRF